MSKTLNGDYPIASYRSISVLATGQLIKTGKTCLYEFTASNTGAAVAYLKFYDKATAGASTDTPLRTYALPAGGSISVNASDLGIAFALGMSIRAVTGVADNNTTAPGANEVIVNIGYR